MRVSLVSFLCLGSSVLGDVLRAEQLLREIMLRSEGPEAEVLAMELRDLFPLVKNLEFPASHKKPTATSLPTVTAHGMGDSCFNGGMKRITKEVASHTGTYGVCVPTGSGWLRDTMSGFLVDMDTNVDVFAAAIQNNSELAGGFNAIGFSQGNSLIRGYIQKFNDPPVNTFLSVHGTVSGVAGFPSCDPSAHSFCKLLAEVCGDLAYNSFVQKHLFQADYFRDPTKVGSDKYETHSELAQWNNEGSSTDDTIKTNFGKTNRFAMIKAEGDTMVYPNEGEWWGHFDDDSFDTVLPMNETDWYKQDLFGLKTADDSGKIVFNSTTGDHLQFTSAQLLAWVDAYF